MAQLPGVFTPSDVDSSNTIPNDWYIAQIVKSEMKATKDKKGQYLALSFKVMEGKYKGRMLFTNLNLVNKNDTTVRIAESDLKAMCEACGIDKLEDSVDLHGIPMGVKAVIVEASNNWPAKNELKGFKDATEVDVEEDDDTGDAENPFAGFDEPGENMADDTVV